MILNYIIRYSKFLKIRLYEVIFFWKLWLKFFNFVNLIKKLYFLEKNLILNEFIEYFVNIILFCFFFEGLDGILLF